MNKYTASCWFCPGGRGVYQDQLLPLLPLPLPGPLRQPLGERAAAAGEGAGGRQDQRADGRQGAHQWNEGALGRSLCSLDAPHSVTLPPGAGGGVSSVSRAANVRRGPSAVVTCASAARGTQARSKKTQRALVFLKWLK